MKNRRFLFIAATLVLSLLLPDMANASKLTQASVELGRLGIGASSGNSVLVTFNLNTTPTSVAKIAVTFPTGFTLTAGTPTPLTPTSSPTSFPNTPATTTPPGTLTSTVTSAGAGLGGTIVVSGLTSASLVAGTLYGFLIPTGSVTNPSTAGQYNTSVASQNSGGTPIDTTTTPVYMTGATANKDQISVSESVAPNFNFSLSANADTVPPVDTTAVQTSSGVNMVVSTNSPLGYTAYVKSTNAALTSASTSSSIPTGTFDGTPDTLSPGTASKYGFVPTSGTLCANGGCSSGATLTYDGEYNGIGASQAGSFNGTNFSSFVSRVGYTGGDTISLKERVAISGAQPYANDYSDTLTIVAAGNF